MASEADAARSFYDRLAADYHLIYQDWEGAGARQVAILDGVIREALGRATVGILDCACGIGTQALGLAARGHRVTGSDLSPAAVNRAAAEARRRRLDVRFVVADMREVDRRVAGGFDVALAADNALPHLLTRADVRAAIRPIAATLRPEGLFVASVRDYDDALITRPETWPARLFDDQGRRRIVQQVWEWLDERQYRVHLYLTRELEAGWRCDHHVGHYRAWRRAELSDLLEEEFAAIRWLMPDATGYHQPIVLARRKMRRGAPEGRAADRGQPL